MQNDRAAKPPLVTSGTLPDADEALQGGASTRHAYEQLRSKILLGELAPGTAFSQVQLSRQLGVSRTPLREAVRLLQTEGLLQSEPKRRGPRAAGPAGGFQGRFCEPI